jgi:hypothetical protein
MISELTSILSERGCVDIQQAAKALNGVGHQSVDRRSLLLRREQKLAEYELKAAFAGAKSRKMYRIAFLACSPAEVRHARTA